MARLAVSVNGMTFSNPVLPAAGPNVRSGPLLQAAVDGGAGGIVTKTVSVHPAVDPRPTLAKGAGGALFNCETWSETPVEEMLAAYRAVKARGVPLICSLGYHPDDLRVLGPLLEREVAPDALEFSVHYVGKSLEPLLEVARALRESVSVPLWMKLSPSIGDVEELVRAASPFVDAFVAINSVGPALDFDPAHPRPRLGSSWGQGWLSGPSILPLALAFVFRVAQAQPKPVIGVGGIASGEDAAKFLMAGASLVQVCTAALRGGPGTYGRIARELDEWIDAHGYSAASELRGRYAAALAAASLGEERP